MMRLVLNIFSIFLSILCLFLIIFFNDFSNLIISFIENNFSNDKNIQPINKFGIKLYLILIFIFFLILSILCFYKFRNFLHKSMKDIIDLPKLTNFLFFDELTKKNYSYYFFAISIIICLSITPYYLIIGAPAPEGFIESFLTFFFLVSALIFLFSFFLVLKEKEKIYKKKSILLFLFLLSSFMFFIFLEEFSWGQKYFNREVSEFFLKYNFQGETTVHNFFNPLFPLVYPLFGFMILISCIISWFFSPSLKTNFRIIFEPHPSLSLLILLMCSFSIKSNTEFFEEFFSIFCFFYSLRILLCIINPQKKVFSLQFHKNTL